MKILNLAYPDKSILQYKITKFPDGQQQVDILGEYNRNELRALTNPMIHFRDYSESEPTVKVIIKSRLNNFKDLELICCAVASLRNIGVKEIHLNCPYFEGSRSDRQFEKGSNNYLKQVICPIINSLNFESVTVLDPYSDVLEACLNHYKKISNIDLVKFALDEIYEPMPSVRNFVLISPDAGANKKIYKIADAINYKGEVITCSKDRDTNGKLSRVVVPMKPDYTTKDLIIIDDLIDGGQTFINIVKEIDGYQKNYKSIYGEKYLIITHGIFSKGFSELSQYFNGIYCTNSYQDIVLDTKLYKENFLKQLKVI